MDVNGNFNTHNHKNWMKRRRQEESFSNQVTDSVSLSIASGILENRRQNVEMASRLRLDFGTAGFQQHPHPHTVQVLTSSSNPRPQDVLLGRGNNTLYHQGNIRFREVIEQYVDDYYRIHKAARRLLGVQIVHKFLQTGTRFLKLGANDQGWIPVDEKAAYVKVCQSFRTLKRTKG